MDLSIPSGVYSTQSITSNTNVRDVSSLLELWAHKDTPLLNRLSWGPESGGLIIEWVHEHLGWGYFVSSGALASNGTTMEILSTGTGHQTALELTKQVHPGTVLFAQAGEGTQSGGHVWMIVTTVAASGSISVAFLRSATGSFAANTTVYIIGSFAHEGSTPDRDVSRARTLLSNKMTILRKDIRITGSQGATDMHAVANELQHQIRLRLLEMQYDRERSVLYSWSVGRTSTANAVGLLMGMAEWLLAQSAQAFVDDSTTSLTESTFNDLVADIFDNGGTPNVVVGPITQLRKFTAWDRDRIRTVPDARMGGHWITRYLTDSGIELDLLPLKKAVKKFLFILDTEKISLRAKKGRKLLLQKLGLAGDYQEWQLISEYSMEARGTTDGGHGMFTVLA